MTLFDDKIGLILPFIYKLLQRDPTAAARRPLLVGLNGIQGIGKSTLVQQLETVLNSDGIKTVVCSLDDFYLTHEDQVKLSNEHPSNALWQQRGSPGTHDIKLANSVLASALNSEPVKLPVYNKAAFQGRGDRQPEGTWPSVNGPADDALKVILLEGWCVGFRCLKSEDIAARRDEPSVSLRKHSLEHLLLMNDKLREYDGVTDLLAGLIHIDSENLEYVYAWRQEQEESLRRSAGDSSAGMTPQQVVTFVDSYYPAYELYLPNLRLGIFNNQPGCQLHITVDQRRQMTRWECI